MASAPPSRTPRAELAAGIAAIVVGIAVIAAVPQLRHCVSLVAHGQFAALRAYIQSLGAGGFALLLGLMVVHAIVWYPSEIVTTTAGYVYGFLPGLAFAVGGWFVAALLSYALGRSVGRPLLRRLLGRRRPERRAANPPMSATRRGADAPRPRVRPDSCAREPG